MTEPSQVSHQGQDPDSDAEVHAALAFDALYDEHFGFVWRTLRALGLSQSLLDDAVQDVFLAVHRQLPGFEARSSPRTWICGIACNIAANYRRRERRKGGLVPLDPGLPAVASGPLEHLQTSQAWAIVSRFLDALDEGKRAVYVLSRIEGLSAPEIAEALSIPANTAYSRLHAAEEALKKFLADNGQGVFP